MELHADHRFEEFLPNPIVSAGPILHSVYALYEQRARPDVPNVRAVILQLIERFPDVILLALQQVKLPGKTRVGRCLSTEELEENPERGLDVLRYCLDMCPSENWRDPRWRKRAVELKMGWIEARRPLPLKVAEESLAKAKDFTEAMTIRYWAGRRGRPVINRQAAIKALVLLHYLDNPPEEVTKLVCPCGLEHNDDRVRTQCMPTLKSEVRFLNRLLRDLNITLPESPMVP